MKKRILMVLMLVLSCFASAVTLEMEKEVTLEGRLEHAFVGNAQGAADEIYLLELPEAEVFGTVEKATEVQLILDKKVMDEIYTRYPFGQKVKVTCTPMEGIKQGEYRDVVAIATAMEYVQDEENPWDDEEDWEAYYAFVMNDVRTKGQAYYNKAKDYAMKKGNFEALNILETSMEWVNYELSAATTEAMPEIAGNYAWVSEKADIAYVEFLNYREAVKGASIYLGPRNTKELVNTVDKGRAKFFEQFGITK